MEPDGKEDIMQGKAGDEERMREIRQPAASRIIPFIGKTGPEESHASAEEPFQPVGDRPFL